MSKCTIPKINWRESLVGGYIPQGDGLPGEKPPVAERAVCVHCHKPIERIFPPRRNPPGVGSDEIVQLTDDEIKLAGGGDTGWRHISNSLYYLNCFSSDDLTMSPLKLRAMPEPKLLNCPFCRSEQVELQSEFDYANIGWANVVCLHCLAHGPTAKTFTGMTIKDVEGKAVFEWNNRQ